MLTPLASSSSIKNDKINNYTTLCLNAKSYDFKKPSTEELSTIGIYYNQASKQIAINPACKGEDLLCSTTSKLNKGEVYNNSSTDKKVSLGKKSEHKEIVGCEVDQKVVSNKAGTSEDTFHGCSGSDRTEPYTSVSSAELNNFIGNKINENCVDESEIKDYSAIKVTPTEIKSCTNILSVSNKLMLILTQTKTHVS